MYSNIRLQLSIHKNIDFYNNKNISKHTTLKYDQQSKYTAIITAILNEMVVKSLIRNVSCD